MMREQPNFEDERSLLSARRVVPLEKIDAKERHRRHWLLGGAFAVAMLLGAASALVASYMKLRNSSVARTEISDVESPAMPVAIAEKPSGGELPAVENVADAQNNEELVVPVAPKKAPTVRQRASVSSNTDLVRPRVVRERDEDDEDELERIREAVLIDSWQERRARRAARRERRNRMNHYDRDLSNLDEIFQGRRNRP
jgi:hypothetical protein